PPPVQRPRPPVWVGGFWPHRRPMCRAARWDGAVPLFLDAKHGYPPPADQVADLVAYVHQQREGGHDRPFEIVIGGVRPAGPARTGARGPPRRRGAAWTPLRRARRTAARWGARPPRRAPCRAAPQGGAGRRTARRAAQR